LRKSPRQILIKLGAEALADRLLDLASHCDEAAKLVTDLTSRTSSARAVDATALRSSLAATTNVSDSVDEEDYSIIAENLEAWLDELADQIEDPRLAIELLVEFYSTDSLVIERIDDEYGSVAEIYASNARALFVSFAAQCGDKDWLVDLVTAICARDDYGVRRGIVESAQQYLPEPHLRALADIFFDHASNLPPGAFNAKRWLQYVEKLARQLKDASLFERACLASDPGVGGTTRIHIADAYLDAGDAATALSWIESSLADPLNQCKRDSLLLTAYLELGRIEQAAEVGWRMFRANRCRETLDRLLQVIGEDQRESVINGEINEVFSEEPFSYQNALYLIEFELIDAADAYILKHAGSINGGFYGSILPIANALEHSGRALAATVLYRSLIDSILLRGKSASYHHGADYLARLVTLASSVADWMDLASHEQYLATIRRNHSRKSSFWAQCQRIWR